MLPFVLKDTRSEGGVKGDKGGGWKGKEIRERGGGENNSGIRNHGEGDKREVRKRMGDERQQWTLSRKIMVRGK